MSWSSEKWQCNVIKESVKEMDVAENEFSFSFLGGFVDQPSYKCSR